jgi:DNA invertase Pin-like site-specific DNA recombinase
MRRNGFTCVVHGCDQRAMVVDHIKRRRDGDPQVPSSVRLLLQVMGALAEFERSMILVRTAEGRKRALDRGVKFGRKSKLTPFQKREVLIR